MPDITAITREEFAEAIQYLRSLSGYDADGFPIKLTLPYDMLPMDAPGGNNDPVWEDAWDNYQWNPPEYSDYTESQPGVSSKPSWATILDAVEKAYVQRRKTELCDFLRVECRSRITSAYGETDPLDEIFARLSGNQAGDADRDMLRIRYAVAKASVMAATTRAEVDALDLSDWFA